MASGTFLNINHRKESNNTPSLKLSPELNEAIKYLVSNVSKSFIVNWYGVVSQTNHDFVIGVDTLLETTLMRISSECSQSLDKYKTCLIFIQLLHEHVFQNDCVHQEEPDHSRPPPDSHHQQNNKQSSGEKTNTRCDEDGRPNCTNNEKKKTSTTKGDEYKTCEKIVIRLYDLVGSDELRRVKRTALYKLVIGMLTKSVFLPIIDKITSPRWLYSLLVWYCEYELDRMQQIQHQQPYNDHTMRPINQHQNNSVSHERLGRIKKQKCNNIDNKIDDSISLKKTTKKAPKSMDSAIAWLADLQKTTLQLHICTRTTHTKMRLERILDSKALLTVDELRSILRKRYGHYVNMKQFDDSRSSKFKTLGAIGSGGSGDGIVGNNKRFSSASASYDTYAFKASYDDRFNRTPTRSKFYTMDSYSNLGSMFASLMVPQLDSQSDSSSSSTDGGDDDNERYYDANDEAVWLRGVHDDNHPIATRLIEILHYTISGNVQCSTTATHKMAKFFLGSTIEQYTRSYLVKALTEQTAANCINGITSSIWPEEEVIPAIDLGKGTAEQATQAIVQLIERRHLNYPLVLLARMLRRYIDKLVASNLQQVSSQQRNKAFVYAFLGELISDLET